MYKKNHLKGLYHENCGNENHKNHGHHENCGCENHEHHEHLENCGCENHEHHGHHENCGCENHEHHGHHENCGCGHNHSHGESNVLIGKLGEHLVGTMTAYTTVSLPIAEMNMNLSMKDVTMYIKELNGVPMQMKASVKDSETTVTMNMLGRDIYRAESNESTENDKTRVKCNLLAVADGISAEELRSKLEEIKDYFVNNAF